jgi:hypothetical protein
MPTPTLTLWADANNNVFAKGYQINQNLANLALRQGDTLGVELHWIESGGNIALHKEIVWDESINITLAIGVLDSAPTGGTFKLTYGSATTSALSYTATASEMQTALNALAPITSEGGVVVSKTATTYRIVWNNAVVPSHSIVVGENVLVPTSSIGIGTARAGSVSVSQITQLHIKQSPVAVCTSWANQESPTISVVETSAPAYSGDYRIWRLSISPSPKGGTFRLAKTINGSQVWCVPINVNNLTANTIETSTGLTTTQISTYEFEISQQQISGDTLVNVSVITPDGSGIIGYSSKFGYLNLNSLDVDLLLNGKSSVSVIAEIEVEKDGNRQTLVQSPATIYNDLIDTDSYSIVTWGSLVPADSVVRYDTPQTLTAPQKAQVLTNIGAIGSTSLVPYTNKDNELEGRIANIETVSLSSDIIDALNGANTPDAGNVFITDVVFATKADVTHTHTIANVTGLQTALDGKIGIGVSVPISDVTGLQTELNDLNTNKASVLHSHLVSDITGFNNGVESALALTTADTTQTTIDTTTYPKEISITIGGVVYKIPARI